MRRCIYFASICFADTKQLIDVTTGNLDAILNAIAKRYDLLYFLFAVLVFYA